jgi:hypothetical protein
LKDVRARVQVAVYFELRRRPERNELDAGTVEGAFEPAGKFHDSCYEAMRGAEPEKWPALASPT